ncbi:MAG: DsbA family protein [Acidimicrobiia bacterium]|nr:DsbA family protein [Acidimicrobiia bacterium]
MSTRRSSTPRHVDDRDLRERSVLEDVLDEQGVDPGRVFETIDSGATLDTVRDEHEQTVVAKEAWGVPTLFVGDRAVFVRLMDGPADAVDARRTVERLHDQIRGWPELNELKATTRRR